MLNELKSLSESMEDAGISMQSWHKDLKELPNTQTFKVYVGEDGVLKAIQQVQRDEIKNMRKFGNNQASFPVFNFEFVIQVEVSKEFSKLTNKKNIDPEEMVSFLNQYSSVRKTPAGADTEEKTIEGCINRIPSELEEILGEIHPEYQALSELFARVSKIKTGEFSKQLMELAFEKIRNEPGNVKIWAGLLSSKSSLVLEPEGKFEYPVNHWKTLKWINSRLCEADKSDWNPSAFDAFNKPIDYEKAKDKLPEIQLPILGKVKLRAMFEEHKCQYRYDKIGSESFPVGLVVREDFKAALEWLGDENRKGKTWANITGISGYGRGLLFAYPSELSKNIPESADIFAPEDDETDPDGVNFEAKAARVIPLVHGIVKEVPDAKMNIFILVKPDGFRTKVLFSERYELSRLPYAAEEWEKGCANIPFLLAEPSTPFPSEVVKCLQCQWIRDGSEMKMTETHGLGIGEGIKLLMETESFAAPIIERALNLAMKNSTPLLLDFAHEKQKGSKDYSFPGKGWVRKANKDKGFKAVHQVNLLPPIIGLLLFKLNIHKEDYMQNAPFLMGRFLAFVDLLHKEYCKNVRGDEKGQGGIPNQLIGNAMMRTALVDPKRAMSQLSDRLPVYQGWATTRGTGLSRWTLKRMGEITNELSETEWPERMRDAEKAQLLLGYLAREPKEVDQDENTNENKTN